MEEKNLKKEDVKALSDAEMENVTGGEDGIKCPYCKHSFGDSIGLVDHIASVHTDTE